MKEKKTAWQLKGGGSPTDHSHQHHTIAHRLQLAILGKPVQHHQQPLKVRVPRRDHHPEHRVRLAHDVLVVHPGRDGRRLLPLPDVSGPERLGGALQEVQVGALVPGCAWCLRRRVDRDGALEEVEGLGEAWDLFLLVACYGGSSDAFLKIYKNKL